MSHLKLVVDNTEKRYVSVLQTIRPYHLITNIQQVNPFTRGSKRFHNYEIIITSPNVGLALERMKMLGYKGTMANIKDAMKRGLITLEQPEEY